MNLKRIILTAFLTVTATVCIALTSCAFPFFNDSSTPDPEPPKPVEPLFSAENWVYMTNNNGASKDSGGVPTTLADRSIKFHNANQAYEYDEDLANGGLDFMLKGSKNWQLWFLSESKDNTADSYKLIYKDGVMSVTTLSNGAAQATAAASLNYKVNSWNKFELDFSTEENSCTLSLTVNDAPVAFVLSANASADVAVSKGNFIHTRPDDFTAGNYICAKVWYGDCFLQLKAVEDAATKDVKKIACLGDSITYGANALNSYTDSYPAQLQNLYEGEVNVMNFGKSGATVRDSADDPYRLTPEYNGAKLFCPDVAIIMLGTNDSKTYQTPTKNEIVTAFTTLIDELRNLNPDMEIYIATSPVAYASLWQINNANVTQIIVPAQMEVATAYDLTVIPMNEYTQGFSNLYADGIHMNNRGYEYLAYRMHCDVEGISADEDYIDTFRE